jgi:iron complex transport system substrate-binding protein
MVARAGGQDVLGCLGKPSFRITAEQILAAQPEVVFAMPCGYRADQAAAEYSRMRFPDGWNELPAVRDARVFAMNASGYFSRPGPRLADGVEILSAVIHPARATAPIPAGAILRIAEMSHRAAVL